MKKTANYGLNLWEKADRIQMEDFNADNTKIENALTCMPKISVGTYTGSGDASIPVSVSVGFHPVAVLIIGKGRDFSSSSVFITQDTPFMYLNTALAKITETGFIVNRGMYSNSPVSPYTNENNSYTYLAIG